MAVAAVEGCSGANDPVVHRNRNWHTMHADRVVVEVEAVGVSIVYCSCQLVHDHAGQTLLLPSKSSLDFVAPKEDLVEEEVVACTKVEARTGSCSLR